MPGSETSDGSTVTEISGAGVVLSPVYGYGGGGLDYPTGVAIDGSGNVWIANRSGGPQYSGSVTELIGAGTPVVTPIAAGLPATPTTNGTSNLGTRP